MTKGRSASKNKKNGNGQKRNKTTDAFGNKYDRRKGKWGAINEAIRNEGEFLTGWLTKERCQAELDILNHPEKRGRPYLYPPSLILFITLLKEDDDRSYRRAASRVGATLEALGLPWPDYTTVHKSEYKFFAGDFGQRVIRQATMVLREAGIVEDFDPDMLIGTGVCPEFQAPETIVTCQRELDEQTAKEREAEELRGFMEVTVLKDATGGDRARNCAIDGSGEMTSGTGVYMEHVWKINSRRFIKQHALVDVDTQEVVAFSVTMEKPGDSKLFIPIVSGALASGVRIDNVYADTAYDGVANWKFADESGIGFVPNLDEGFKENWELERRNGQLRAEKEYGKTLYHRITGYNSRWLVEVFFSILKKLYGDSIRSRKFSRMVLVMRNRYRLYSIHRRLMMESEAKHGLAEVI